MNPYCIENLKWIIGITHTNIRVHRYNYSKLVTNLPRGRRRNKKEDGREVPGLI